MEKPRPSWLEDKSVPVFLAVGRLAKQKDYPTLIRAFSIVREKMNARLIILGVGDEKDNLVEYVNSLGLSQNVDFKGFEENPYSYLSNVDGYVLSSIYEGFANVLIEALACEAKIVSTAFPSAIEILENGKYGEIVPIEDYKHMADAMLNMLSDSRDRASLKIRSNDFHIDKIIPEYEKIL